MSQTNGWDGILAPGEEILWQGAPSGEVIWRDMLTFKSAFGFFFFAFSLVWTGGAFFAAGAGGSDGFSFLSFLFPLFGLPFLAVGFYMFIGHIFIDALKRSKSWYTLTDRTAFIASEFLGRRSLKSYPIRDMPLLELDDGTQGTVWFGEKIHRTKNGSTTEKIGFIAFDDARKVYGLIRECRRALNEHEREQA